MLQCGRIVVAALPCDPGFLTFSKHPSVYRGLAGLSEPANTALQTTGSWWISQPLSMFCTPLHSLKQMIAVTDELLISSRQGPPISTDYLS